MARVKYGGRKAGVPNKVGSELRDLITTFLDGNWQQVQTDIMELEPKERVKFYIDLMAYAVPKLQATSIDVSTGGQSIAPTQIIVQDKQTADEVRKLIAGG